ncbi:MAG TPA: asparaginase [Acidimicrobiia bacterium]|nr:asparaginase [Acidimicrobiia bacterium]
MLAVVERSGLDEAFHEGCVAVADPSGRLTAWFGDVDRHFFVRSAAKPFQAAVCLQSGVDLPPEHLAVACASHDGTPVHVEIVRRILSDGGLDESDLGCPPARPLSATADREWAGRGSTERRRVFHDCSGKHALMLRACVAAGWDPAGYLDPGHPLQIRQLEGMRAVGALVDDTVGIDGCGAPVFRVSGRTLAAAYARLSDPVFAPVWTAMHRYPALVSGSGNADTEIAVGLHAVAKRGAEGLLAVAVAGRGSLVVRCWDGSERAVAVAALSALDQLGWIGERTPLRQSLGRPVRGGGVPVGSVRPVFQLEHA